MKRRKFLARTKAIRRNSLKNFVQGAATVINIFPSGTVRITTKVRPASDVDIAALRTDVKLLQQDALASEVQINRLSRKKFPPGIYHSPASKNE